MFAMWKKS